MKTVLLVILGVLTTEFLLAQPTPLWSSSISSDFNSYLWDKPQIKFDNSGDLMVVGNTNHSSNGSDFLILKYSPTGDTLWTHTYDGINNLDDYASDFEIDSLNNIFITGKSMVDSVNADLITIKYDADGNFKWVNSFNGNIGREDYGKSIAVDQSGNTYVTGFTTIDSLEFQQGKQAVTTKIDSSGNTVWTRFYGTDTAGQYTGEKIKIINNEIRILASNLGIAIVLKYDTSGTLLLSNETPVSRPPSCFYLDNLGNSYLGFGGWERYKTMKLNPSGNIDWSQVIATNMPSNWTGDEVRAIIVDSQQTVYVTGRHYGDDFNGPTYSNADILTVRYTSNGAPMWIKRYEYQGNNAADIGNAITLDNHHNAYVVGQSERELTDYDYVVLKYNSSGNLLGSIRYNDTANGDDIITSVVVSDSAEIYVTGLTFDSLLSFTTTQKYGSVSGVGIYELNDKQISINAFPNPFSNITSIYFPNTDNTTFDFQLSDYSGKVILKQKTNSDNIQVSADLTPGLYTFTLYSDKRAYNGKIIKTE